MRLTIIRADGAVYKDNISYSGLDLSAVPTNIHALQWYETEGEIEFNGSPKPQNEFISELPDWANNCVSVFNNQVAANQAAQAEAEARASQNQPTTTGTQTL
jgi:uncharacterized protein YfdQ (DUF2303 family)